MNGYSWVSIISILCYLFLLLSLVSSKKKEKVIRSFIVLMAIMILWNGGSLGMRIQLWPNVNFWHHISLLGTLLLPFGYVQFLTDFLDESESHGQKFWLISYLLVFVFNFFTGFFIPLPEVITENGQVQFLYRYNWHIYLLFVLIVLTLVHFAFLIWRHCRGNRIALHQLMPVIAGILAIALGHLLATLPIFIGFPLDMLSGAVNAVFLFYALYRKKLFRMTILLSKANYIIIAMILGILIFSDLALPIQNFFIQTFGMSNTAALILIAILLVVMISALYFLITVSFNAIFTRKEQKKKAALAHFSEEITHMLNVNEILQSMADTIQNIVEMDRLFVLIRGADGHYHIEHTINPLEEKNFYIRSDHPLITYFKTHRGYVLTQNFSRSTVYRGMWEKEKALLINQQIEGFVPLTSDDELIGFLMLTSKHNQLSYQPNNFLFLQSVADRCVTAVKNAYDYEKALQEAQKDELTGLINAKFFYEILDREFEKNKDTALSLCLFNIDDFKRYNQLYGTHEGDWALQRIAGILLSSINENAYAARVNGDEFALILPGYDVYSAKCLADNISEQINNIGASFTNDISSNLTVSGGICAAPYMASSSNELYRNANTTVYAVKRTGKNTVQVYSADIHRRETANSLHRSGYDENANTIYALTAAIDAKDHYTFQHSQNVSYYASELAKAAGMSSDVVGIVKEAGLLHDLGKIGIPEDILNKPDKLTPDEYEIMKSHVENAVNIIRHLPLLDYVIPAVLSHHERYDGKGYPRKLSGDNIPITGRILCIADSFDAITSVRGYKEAVSVQEAISILRSEAGKQFDPNLVEIFISLLESGDIKPYSAVNFAVPVSPLQEAENIL